MEKISAKFENYLKVKLSKFFFQNDLQKIYLFAEIFFKNWVPEKPWLNKHNWIIRKIFYFLFQNRKNVYKINKKLENGHSENLEVNI